MSKVIENGDCFEYKTEFHNTFWMFLNDEFVFCDIDDRDPYVRTQFINDGIGRKMYLSFTTFLYNVFEYEGNITTKDKIK